MEVYTLVIDMQSQREELYFDLDGVYDSHPQGVISKISFLFNMYDDDLNFKNVLFV